MVCFTACIPGRTASGVPVKKITPAGLSSALRLGVLAAVLMLSAVPLSAHPHMFFSSRAEFEWDGEQLNGVWLEWTFDAFFSADILMGYDLDSNGLFNTAETQKVYSGAFVNLQKYYFFTFIRQGARRYSPDSVERFSVINRNGRVSYRFFIDLSDSRPDQDLYLAVYDYTFFCNVEYPESEPVVLRYDPQVVRPAWTIVENKSFPVYYNPRGAIDDTRVYYEYKEGLAVYYPREIRIRYEKIR